MKDWHVNFCVKETACTLYADIYSSRLISVMHNIFLSSYLLNMFSFYSSYKFLIVRQNGRWVAMPVLSVKPDNI